MRLVLQKVPTKTVQVIDVLRKAAGPVRSTRVAPVSKPKIGQQVLLKSVDHGQNVVGRISEVGRGFVRVTDDQRRVFRMNTMALVKHEEKPEHMLILKAKRVYVKPTLEHKGYFRTDPRTPQPVAEPTKIEEPKSETAEEKASSASLHGKKIVDVVSVVDTREWEEGEDDKFHPIPGSGTENVCARCGRLHEVHATVKLEDDSQAVVGVSCAKQKTIDQKIKAKLAVAQTTKRLEASLKHAREKLATAEEAWKKVEALPAPKITYIEESNEWGTKTVGTMGDAKVWSSDRHFDEERRAALLSQWRMYRFNEMGFDSPLYFLRNKVHDLESKLAKHQKRSELAERGISPQVVKTTPEEGKIALARLYYADQFEKHAKSTALEAVRDFVRRNYSSFRGTGPSGVGAFVWSPDDQHFYAMPKTMAQENLPESWHKVPFDWVTAVNEENAPLKKSRHFLVLHKAHRLILRKGKSYPTGTIRYWKGQAFKKTATGERIPYNLNYGRKATEEEVQQVTSSGKGTHDIEKRPDENPPDTEEVKEEPPKEPVAKENPDGTKVEESAYTGKLDPKALLEKEPGLKEFFQQSYAPRALLEAVAVPIFGVGKAEYKKEAAVIHPLLAQRLRSDYDLAFRLWKLADPEARANVPDFEEFEKKYPKMAEAAGKYVNRSSQMRRGGDAVTGLRKYVDKQLRAAMRATGAVGFDALQKEMKAWEVPEAGGRYRYNVVVNPGYADEIARRWLEHQQKGTQEKVATGDFKNLQGVSLIGKALSTSQVRTLDTAIGEILSRVPSAKDLAAKAGLRIKVTTVPRDKAMGVYVPSKKYIELDFRSPNALAHEWCHFFDHQLGVSSSKAWEEGLQKARELGCNARWLSCGYVAPARTKQESRAQELIAKIAKNHLEKKLPPPNYYSVAGGLVMTKGEGGTPAYREHLRKRYIQDGGLTESEFKELQDSLPDPVDRLGYYDSIAPYAKKAGSYGSYLCDSKEILARLFEQHTAVKTQAEKPVSANSKEFYLAHNSYFTEEEYKTLLPYMERAFEEKGGEGFLKSLFRRALYILKSRVGLVRKRVPVRLKSGKTIYADRYIREGGEPTWVRRREKQSWIKESDPDKATLNLADRTIATPEFSPLKDHFTKKEYPGLAFDLVEGDPGEVRKKITTTNVYPSEVATYAGNSLDFCWRAWERTHADDSKLETAKLLKPNDFGKNFPTFTTWAAKHYKDKDLTAESILTAMRTAIHRVAKKHTVPEENLLSFIQELGLREESRDSFTQGALDAAYKQKRLSPTQLSKLFPRLGAFKWSRKITIREARKMDIAFEELELVAPGALKALGPKLTIKPRRLGYRTFGGLFRPSSNGVTGEIEVDLRYRESFAHEMGHALEYLVKRKYPEPGVATEEASQWVGGGNFFTKTSVGKSLWNDLVQKGTIKRFEGLKSRFYEGYQASPVEVFARIFEQYTAGKLEKEHPNRVTFSTRTAFALTYSSAYLAADEAQDILPKFGEAIRAVFGEEILKSIARRLLYIQKSREGLTRKRVTVRGKGKTFQAYRWVKVGQEESPVKAESEPEPTVMSPKTAVEGVSVEYAHGIGKESSAKSVKLAATGLRETFTVFKGLGKKVASFGAKVQVGTISGLGASNASYLATKKVLFLDDERGKNSLGHEVGHMVDQMLQVTGRVLPKENYDRIDAIVKERRPTGPIQYIRRALFRASIVGGKEEIEEAIRGSMLDLIPEVKEELLGLLTTKPSVAWKALYDYEQTTSMNLKAPTVEEAGDPGIRYTEYVNREPEVWARIFNQYFAYQYSQKNGDAKPTSSDSYKQMVDVQSHSDVHFASEATKAGYKYAPRHFMDDKEFQKAVPLIEACLKGSGFVKSLLRAMEMLG